MTSTRTEVDQTTASRIPTFATIEEEAEFWDTHSFSEFEDELEEVSGVKFISLWPDGKLILWLEPEQAAALTRQAAEQGTYPARLALSWVLERLQVEATTGTPTPPSTAR